MAMTKSANRNIIFRLLGGFSVLLGIGCLSVAFRNMHVAESGGRDLSALFYWAVAFLVTGLCSLMCRPWAGYLLALVGAIYGVVLIAGSLLTVAFPWLLINVALGIGLLVPAVALIRDDPTPWKRWLEK
jgi:hypothetical protein